MVRSMNRLFAFGVCIALVGASAANADSVQMSFGTLSTTVTPDGAWNKVDIHISSLTGVASGAAITSIQGAWTAMTDQTNAGGTLGLSSTAWQAKTLNTNGTDGQSWVNFDADQSPAQFSRSNGSGTAWGSFTSGTGETAGAWYTGNTTDYLSATPGSGIDSPDNTLLAEMYVTPGKYIAFSGFANLTNGQVSVPLSFNTAPVPEPSMLALLVSGLIGLAAYAWKKRK